MLVNNQCGLCKYFYSDTPYKLINTSQFLSENDIPVGAEIYNSKLYLLKCKSGYILKDGTCITHCYETCDTCYEYSEDITNQKCETCKINYILDSNRNCISPPTTIITTILTTISTTILTTIPKKFITTIPTTIATTLPAKIPTTIPTTIPAKIPTTIKTTTPAEIKRLF